MKIIDPKLLNNFLKVSERAAFGASRFRGKNDKIAADQAAVDEMRSELNKIQMIGRVVIGEGEMDEAPMLYIGEKVGTGTGDEFDIAVDPLEGTNFTAKNLPNAISVLAVANKGGLLSAPDTYMEKIAIGSGLPKNIIDLDVQFFQMVIDNYEHSLVMKKLPFYRLLLLIPLHKFHTRQPHLTKLAN